MSSGYPQQSQVDDLVNEYWSWFAVGLFLLITVDLLTTLGATIKYGVVAEANPVMRWALTEGPLVVAALHIGVVVVAVYAFAGVVRAVQHAPPRLRPLLVRPVELWLGFIIAAGLVVFANNLAVIVLGASLL